MQHPLKSFFVNGNVTALAGNQYHLVYAYHQILQRGALDKYSRALCWIVRDTPISRAGVSDCWRCSWEHFLWRTTASCPLNEFAENKFPQMSPQGSRRPEFLLDERSRWVRKWLSKRWIISHRDPRFWAPLDSLNTAIHANPVSFIQEQLEAKPLKHQQWFSPSYSSHMLLGKGCTRSENL